MIFPTVLFGGLWEKYYHEVIGLKKKLLLFGSYVLVAMLATAITLGMVYMEGSVIPTKLEQLESLILERFIGEADPEKLEDAAAAAMVSATGDKWSYYISASEYEAYAEQMANAYVGVGITIQQQEGSVGFLILDVTAGGPAEEAGLQVEDLLIRVADTDVREMTAEEVRNLVRGKEGTFVDMTVLRKGETRTFSVERRKVQTPVATWEMLDYGIGLVTIENFDDRCAKETIGAIETLLDNGAEKLIFDVRNNPGGYAHELVDVLDYLLPEGELFRAVSYDGKENVDYSDADCLELPMAVLVNGGSYSAAEFFAAAMQEYDAAYVVGQQTSGKGYFQTTIHLNDGSAVALSVGKYYTPGGVSLADVGVTPDQRIETELETESAIYYGTLPAGEDPYIQAAVKLLKNK